MQPMAYILVGGGSAQCLLKVEKVPKVGDTLTVLANNIEWARTDNAYFMHGATYKVSKRLDDVETEKLGKVPWFGLEAVH